jgi:uncharacterized protein (DUF1810 family)
MKRFIDAQEIKYELALAEIKVGRKKSHWMWYIFPQIQGLGFSEISQRYATKDLSTTLFLSFLELASSTNSNKS